MIRLSRRAEADLDRIDAWIRPRAGSRPADRVIETILTGIEHFHLFPEIGRHGRVDGTRELIFAPLPYLAVYRLKGADVFIVRILHGAMEWPRPRRRD